MGPSSRTSVLVRGGLGVGRGCTHTKARRQHFGKVEAEARVMHLEASKHQGLSATSRSLLGERHGMPYPSEPPREESGLPASCFPDFQPLEPRENAFLFVK